MMDDKEQKIEQLLDDTMQDFRLRLARALLDADHNTRRGLVARLLVALAANDLVLSPTREADEYIAAKLYPEMSVELPPAAPAAPLGTVDPRLLKLAAALVEANYTCSKPGGVGRLLAEIEDRDMRLVNLPLTEWGDVDLVKIITEIMKKLYGYGIRADQTASDFLKEARERGLRITAQPGEPW